MSRKIRKAVASTLALAMMAGNAGVMPVLQNAVVIQAATSFVQPVGESNVPGGIKGLNIDAGKYEVKAGEEFSLKVKITDNAEGFNTLLTMLDFDNDVFEIGGHVAGDEDDPENEDSDIYNSAFEFNLEDKDAAKSKLITLMSSSSNVKGNVVFFTLKVKVKEGVKDGFYEIPFDVIGDGADNAKANRIVTENGERVPVVLNPTYLGAIVKVGNPTETQPTTEPTTAPTTQPTTTPTTQPTTPGQTDTLTGKVADASGKNGETIKTTLTVSGASVAGIQTSLDFDSSALELTGASASGWTVEINGGEIGAVAEPYQDNSTAAITLEFKAKKEGSHKVGIKSLTGASKESEKEYTGTGTAGTITVSGASTTPTTSPTTNPPSTDAITIELGEATLKDNEDGSKTATVPIYAKNIGNGISTVQFNYEMDSSFTVDRVNKGDFECQWTPGTETKTLQFLTGDGCNIAKEGIIGKIKITIPAGTADGTYPIKMSNFEGSTYDKAADKQIPLENNAFSPVNGKIVIGEGGEVTPTDKPETPTTTPTTTPTSVPTALPTDAPVPGDPMEQPGGDSEVPGGIKALKIDAGTYKVKAGDEFKLKVKVTDNAEGFNTLLTMLDFDNDVFEVGGHIAGDEDDPENEDSDIYNSAFEFNLETKDAAKSKLITLMSSSSNVKGDLVFFTLTVKVKEGVKDGYYAIPFDIVGDGADKAKANRIVTQDGERVPIILNPTYLGAVVQVGEPTTTPTTRPTETPTEPTTEPTSVPTVNPTENPSVSKAVTIELGEATLKDNEDGTKTATVPIYAKNIGNGISTVQFDYDMDPGFTVDRVNKGDFECQWTPGTENRTLQFLTGDGCNIAKEGIIGKVKIIIPAGTADGTYPIKISNFSGSTYDKAADRQIPLEDKDFAGVDGVIVIGNGSTPGTPDDLDYDVNGDGSVTTADIVKLKQYLLLVVDKSAVPGGDINKDGTINSMDMIYLVKKFLQ